MVVQSSVSRVISLSDLCLPLVAFLQCQKLPSYACLSSSRRCRHLQQVPLRILLWCWLWV